MASKQSDAVRKLYQGWLRAFAENPDWTPDDRKDLIERWNVLTTEPGSVDYIEIDAPGGVPALWATPHGANNDRVLLYVHGGGFVSGSMHTHRKLYGRPGRSEIATPRRRCPRGSGGDSLCGRRWRLPLDPAVKLLDVPEGHYSSRVLVCARNSSRVSNAAGSLESSRRIESSR